MEKEQSDLSYDSAPEELTFAQAKQKKPKAVSFKNKIKKQNVKTQISSHLKNLIEEEIPLNSLKKMKRILEVNQNKDDLTSPKKIKQEEPLVKKTKIIDNKIKFVYHNNKMPFYKVNEAILSKRKKYFFEDKKRVSLKEIIS